MYSRTMMIFCLFLVILFLTDIPVEEEPVFFMSEKTAGNVIKGVDLHLKKDDIAISFLELQSGEATLLQDDEGKNVLINTGSKLSARQFKQQMKVFHVDKIDILVLTNIGKQFTGNLPWLLHELEINQVFIADNIVDELVTTLDVPHHIVKPIHAGDRFNLLDDLSVKVKYIEEEVESEKGEMTLDLQYGIHHFLYMGQANEASDKAVISDGPLNASLIKIAGFGHYFGTSDELLDHVTPEVAIIFKKDGYKLSNEVLARLDARWTEVLKPYEQGIVMVKSNKKAYEITQIPLISPDLARK